MSKKLLLLAAIIVGCSTASKAETALHIYNACKATKVTNPSLEDIADSNFCYGYILGANDMLAKTTARSRSDQVKPAATVCHPDGIRVQELALVYLKYMDDHPEKLHLDADDMIISALSAAYPCRA